MNVDIKIGQVWKDVDKRREQEGTVRSFVITEAKEGHLVECRLLPDDPARSTYFFNRSLFVAGRSSQSFALVSEKEA